MVSILSKYAQLLVNYCLNIKEGDRLFIQTTTLAEPLVREVYREALRAGAYIVETDLMFRERSRIFYQEANEAQLATIPPLYDMAMREFDAYLHIRAPFNLREDQNTEGGKIAQRSKALTEINKIYFERTATKSLRRNLCQYPTNAAAQEAGMSLEEYEQFVFNACHLFDSDPQQSWLKVRETQQYIVDYLNQCRHVRYVTE